MHGPSLCSEEAQNGIRLDSTADGTTAAAVAVADAEQQAAAAAVVAKAIAAVLAAEGPEAAPDAPDNPSLASTSNCSTKGHAGDPGGRHHYQQEQAGGKFPVSRDTQQLSLERVTMGCSTDSTYAPSGYEPQQQQQQQQEVHQTGRLLYQGSLKAAAIACGIDAEGSGFNPADSTSSSSSPTAVTHTAAALAATAATAAAAAGRRSGVDEDGMGEGPPGVFLSDAEVEEYLQVEKARLLAR
jgi:hypothetical protein